MGLLSQEEIKTPDASFTLDILVDAGFSRVKSEDEARDIMEGDEPYVFVGECGRPTNRFERFYYNPEDGCIQPDFGFDRPGHELYLALTNVPYFNATALDSDGVVQDLWFIRRPDKPEDVGFCVLGLNEDGSRFEVEVADERVLESASDFVKEHVIGGGGTGYEKSAGDGVSISLRGGNYMKVESVLQAPTECFYLKGEKAIPFMDLTC